MDRLEYNVEGIGGSNFSVKARIKHSKRPSTPEDNYEAADMLFWMAMRVNLRKDCDKRELPFRRKLITNEANSRPQLTSREGDFNICLAHHELSVAEGDEWVAYKPQSRVTGESLLCAFQLSIKTDRWKEVYTCLQNILH